MNLFYAVVWIDLQSAQVLQFDAEHMLAEKIRAHTHHTAQHGSAVRSQHEFFGEVCDEVTTAGTYLRLQAVAHVTLGAGWPVVVDAAFLFRSERAQFAALAAALAVPFSILDCRAALPLLRQRLEQRQASGADPSEADVAVLERLAGRTSGSTRPRSSPMPRNRCLPRRWRSAGSPRRFSAVSAEPITQVTWIASVAEKRAYEVQRRHRARDALTAGNDDVMILLSIISRATSLTGVSGLTVMGL